MAMGLLVAAEVGGFFGTWLCNADGCLDEFESSGVLHQPFVCIRAAGRMLQMLAQGEVVHISADLCQTCDNKTASMFADRGDHNGTTFFWAAGQDVALHLLQYPLL